MSPHVLRSVAFDDSSDSIVIEFMTPSEDVRLNGVCLNHSLLIPATPEFAEVLLEVAMACQQALAGGLASLATADPVELPEDDDAPSPYDNPRDGGQA